MTISSYLNFDDPAPPGRGYAAERKFLAPPTTASAQCLRLSERFFIFIERRSFENLTEDVEKRLTAFYHSIHARKLRLDWSVQVFNRLMWLQI